MTLECPESDDTCGSRGDGYTSCTTDACEPVRPAPGPAGRRLCPLVDLINALPNFETRKCDQQRYGDGGTNNALARRVFLFHRDLATELYLRVVGFELSKAENQLWLAVFDRTLRWGKYVEAISYRQFEGGIHREDGVGGTETIFRGGLDRSTVSRAGEGLSNKGLLTRFNIPANRPGSPDIGYMLLSPMWWKHLTPAGQPSQLRWDDGPGGSYDKQRVLAHFRGTFDGVHQTWLQQVRDQGSKPTIESHLITTRSPDQTWLIGSVLNQMGIPRDVQRDREHARANLEERLGWFRQSR